MIESLLFGSDVIAPSYTGVVPSSEFITYENVSTLSGLTEGSIMPDVGWLEFNVGGVVWMVSRTAVRYRILRSTLATLNLVNGKTITINNQSWLIRLIGGASTRPFTSEQSVNTDGSEWNKLF